MKQIILAAMAASLLLCTAATAQITAAGNADLPVTNLQNVNNFNIAPNFTTVRNMNVDMVDVKNGGKLWAAVVFGPDNNVIPPDYAGLYVEYTGTGGSPSYTFFDNQAIPLAGTYDIDVVIADDPTSVNPGEDYLVAVVYTSLNGSGKNEIKMDVHEYTGVGTITGGHSGSSPYTIASSSTVDFFNPHIDLFGDRSVPSFTNTQSLHNFVITYDDVQVSGGVTTSSVYYRYGDLAPGGGSTVNLPATVTTNGFQSDIGAQGILTPGIGMGASHYNAWISYIQRDPSNAITGNDRSLRIARIQFDNSFTPGAPTTSNVDNSTTFNLLPRIEAQALADVTNNVATWNIVAVPITGGPAINSYTDANIGALVHDVSTATGATLYDYGNRHFSPCVTGVGPNMQSGSSGIGTTQFSNSYASTFTLAPSSIFQPMGDYWNNSIDIAGGTLSSTYNQYYEINQNEVDHRGCPDPERPIAIATSSNTGDDLLSVWYEWDGTNGFLSYKFSGNGYAYKRGTTSISNVNKEAYKVYPNPSVDHLMVKGAAKADYAIMNMTGAIVATGAVDAQHDRINTNSLASGVYLLNLTENGHTQRVKFTKE